MKIEKSAYALVTGASSGIGKAIAFELASRGKKLLITSLPGEKLDEVCTRIHDQYHVDAEYFETDLSDLSGPKKLFQWVSENNYPVDMLVNNAGMAGTAVFAESDDKYIDDRILVNIRALTFLTRYFIPELSRHEQAYILNVSSLSAYYSIPFKSLYSSTKAFVLNFSRALKTEIKDSPVSVSVLCPNGVRTNEGTHGRIESHGAAGKLTSVPVEQVAKTAINNCLKKRFLIIPGKVNWLLLLLGKIIPGPLKQKILYREFSKELK